MSSESICEQLVEELAKRAGIHSAAWHKRVCDLMRGVAERETESGNRSLFLDPMASIGAAADSFDPALAKHLLPVVLTKDLWRCYGRVEEVWKSERLIGLGRIKLYLTPGLVVTYMLEQICQILPLYNEVHDEVGGQLSSKYLLPLVYRHMEETGLPSPYAFEVESQWLGLIKSDIPIETLLTRPHQHPHQRQRPHQHPHQRQQGEASSGEASSGEASSGEASSGEAMQGGSADLRSIILSAISKRGEAVAKRGEAVAKRGEAVMVTGVTAALLELGIPLDRIPLPLELTTADLGPAVDLLRTALSGSDSSPAASKQQSPLEIRQLGVNHPSGSWYVSVVQFILSPPPSAATAATAKPSDRGRIVVMLYDTIRYIAAGVAAPSQSAGLIRLSPFVIMTQLCYSAWLLERRGIERSKWVYSILRLYRNRLASAAVASDEKERYKMISQPVEWLTHYLRRSSPLTQHTS